MASYLDSAPIVTRRAVLGLVAPAAAFQRKETKLGKIDFATSGSPQARERFLRGVMYLHSFEYDDAREEFVAARQADPAFAMAYWGEAMTYNEPLWHRQDAESARKALARLAPTRDERLMRAATPRERAWLGAVEVLYGSGSKEQRDFAYSDAMRQLWSAYPNDMEAASFYALSLLGTSHHGRDTRIYMQAAAVAEEVFARNREHPGALHYLIHCYDDPLHAPLGLRAARIYAQVAPAAAHALHMPSHIFIAMGMWDDVVSSNEDSWAASEARYKRKNLPLEDRGYHALWWLEYAYLQQGRYREARGLLSIVEEDAVRSPSPFIRFHAAHMRSAYAVETGQQEVYQKALDLSDLDIPAAVSYLFARGFLAAVQGDAGPAAAALARIRERRNAASTHEAAGGHEHHFYPPDLQVAGIVEKQLEGVIAMARRETDRGLQLLSDAAAIEDKLPFEFGPPVPPKPAHELLGEMLLAANRPREAQKHFALALERAPRRSLSLLGIARAARKAGDAVSAKAAYAELSQVRKKADVEWAE